MNLDFHPVDGIGIFVSFHSVGIIQLPAVGTILSCKELKFLYLLFATVLLYLLYFLFYVTCCSGQERRKLIVSLLNLFLKTFLKLILELWMEQI